MNFPVLAHELAQWEVQGLKRERRLLQSPQSTHVTVDGRDYIAFCSNDYLGLANDSRVIEAARSGLARHGLGAGASHLVLGHADAHDALERALADFGGLPRALLFSSGYMANVGAITTLVGRTDAVFADRLNHASLNDACLLSRARFIRYPHGDVRALERHLAATPVRRRVIVTDGVFSMDGDVAPLPTLVALAERYDAWLYVDDAHGFGVLGSDGRGILAHTGVPSERIVYMATLGKAAGVFGAFVAGVPELIELLVQKARTYVYTTATPPLLATATLKSLELMKSEQWRRDRLRELVRTLRAGPIPARWRLLDSETAIQPLVIGDHREAVAVAQTLAERGLLVPAIRPPTVPQGTARLRISLSAAHEPSDVEKLVQALGEIGRR